MHRIPAYMCLLVQSPCFWCASSDYKYTDSRRDTYLKRESLRTSQKTPRQLQHLPTFSNPRPPYRNMTTRRKTPSSVASIINPPNIRRSDDPLSCPIIRDPRVSSLLCSLFRCPRLPHTSELASSVSYAQSRRFQVP